MTYKSRWTVNPPTTSLPSFLFTSPTAPLSSKPILIDAGRPETHCFTLHTLREWSKRVAAGLKAAGLQTGERVMLFSGNCIFSPVLVMGVVMAGGIYTSANPAFTPRELAHQLKDSQASFLLAADNCVERALKGGKLADLSSDRIFQFGDVAFDEQTDLQTGTSALRNSAVRHWKELIASPEIGKQFEWEELDTPELANRTMLLIYSSGTTGLPKGVEVSHYNIVSNIAQQVLMQTVGQQTTNEFPESRGLACLPMYHGLGLVYYCWVAPKRGLQVYLMERFELLLMVTYIQRYKITELLMVPPILVAMSKHPLIRVGNYDLGSIRKVTCGAAPLGMEITVQFEALFQNGSVKVRQAWGMSEAPCILLAWADHDTSSPTSISVGELVPSAEAKIMNEDGTAEVPPGEKGEFWCRAPNIMKGYWQNPKATAETLTGDRWLKTGDIAFVDEGGKFYMVDRKKELIKVRGAQVAPAEIEALLLEHPLVVDAAVIGAKINEDEHPRAYVVPRKHALSTITETDIVKFVEERVSKVKRLTGGVCFVEAIPKNPSGKILRRQLRDGMVKRLEFGARIGRRESML